MWHRDCFDQLVHLGIGVESSIRALGSEALGREHVLEDVGIEIAAYPAQRMKLICAFRDVGVEGGELEAVNVERDSDGAQLLLKNGGQQSRRLFRRRLHRKVKAHAVLRGIPSFVEQLARERGVVRVLGYIGIVGPMLRRQYAVGRTRLVTPEVMNDGREIDGVGQRTAHAHVPQCGIAQVQGEVRIDGSRPAQNLAGHRPSARPAPCRA